MEAAFDMAMFNFDTEENNHDSKFLALQDTTPDIPVFENCNRLVQMFPQIQNSINSVRKTVKVSIHFRRNVKNPLDKNVPSSIRTIFNEYGTEIHLLLQYIHDLPISGRKLDLVLFRNNEEYNYDIVRTSKIQARLATSDDEKRFVEHFSMRDSLQKLISKTTRGQVDVFARGDLYQHDGIVFSTAQLILFHWCRQNAVIEYVLTQIPTDVRAQSRKRKSATIVRFETNPCKRNI